MLTSSLQVTGKKAHCVFDAMFDFMNGIRFLMRENC